MTVPAKRRAEAQIAVTGLGAWSAAGTSPDQLGDRVLAGLNPATWLRCGDRLFPACLAPEPPRFTAFPQAHRMDRVVRLALAAAEPAYAQARLSSLDPARIGLLVGNSRGPAAKWSEPASTRTRPSQAANLAIASLSGALSIALNIQGPCLTLSATCASAAHAIALGVSLLHSGEVDVVLAGGAEAPLAEPVLDHFRAAGLLGSHTNPALTCRPFDRSRNGLIPGEGAAFLVLELAEHARERSQAPVAFLAGHALGSEAHNRVATRPDGATLARVIRLALHRAGLEPHQIGYVNAHGTATLVNDTAEAAALDAVFSGDRPRPGVSSTKPITGHTLGAAAALEAVIAIRTLHARLAPPTWTCLDPEPLLPVDLILGRPRPLSTPYAMSTSLGFWGNAAALVFQAPDPVPPDARG